MTPDQRLWVSNASGGYCVWARYLEEFDAVRLLARVVRMAAPPPGWVPASGPGVSAGALPYYLGPWQFLRKIPALLAAIWREVREPEEVLLLEPCVLGELVWRMLEHGHPYGVAVRGNPHGVYAPGAVRHPLRPLFRWWFARQLARECAGACAVTYVTAYDLAERYQASPEAFCNVYSDAGLGAEVFVSEARRPAAGQRHFRIITVGSLAQPYKGIDVLLEAVARCRAGGLAVSLVVLGDGRCRPELEARAARAGIAEHVEFLGEVGSFEAVCAELDRSDLFVLPSRTEGLPRALIEAMARGLPCIGTRVGGIPELLCPRDLVPPNDAGALASRIREALSAPGELAEMAERNLHRVQQYREDLLCERRAAFCRALRTRTEEWLRRGRTAADRAASTAGL